MPGHNQTAGQFIDDRIAYWNKLDAWSTEYMQLFQPGWSRNWRWYMAESQAMNDPIDWWRSNENIAECFKIIETQLPRDVSGMFGEQEWFTIQGRERSDEVYQKVVQSLLMYWVDRAKFFPSAMEASKYKLIMGHVWGKITWREEVETRTVEQTVPFVDEFTGEEGARLQEFQIQDELFNDPDFTWLPLDRVKPDPTGKERFFIEESTTTMEELEETNDRLDIYTNLGDIPESASGTPNKGFTEPQNTLRIPQELVDNSRMGRPVSLQLCWGWVPKNLRRGDGNAWRQVVIANKTVVIRDTHSSTPNGRPPYFGIKSIPIPNQIYGASILQFVGPLQNQQSRIANFRLDEILLNIWQQYVIDRNAGVTSNEMLKQPGGAIFVDVPQGRGVDQVFSVLPRQPVLPEAYTEEGYRQGQAEDIAATFNEIQGKGGDGRKTATESERNFQQGNARFQLATLWSDHTFKKEVLTRVFGWYQKRLPPQRLLRIVGEQDTDIQLDIADIQEPIDITVTSGLQAFNQQLRLQSEQLMMGLAGNEAFAPYMKPGPILRETLKDNGWTNVEKFVRTDEEVQQLFEQQAQQAEQQANAEARREAIVSVVKETSKPRPVSSKSRSSASK